MTNTEAKSTPAATPSRAAVLPFTPGVRRSRAALLKAIVTGHPPVTIPWYFHIPQIVAIGLILFCIAYAGPRDKDSPTATHATVDLVRAAVAAPGPDTAPTGRPVERYFPAQFPPIQGEVLPHIEAF